jgi:hypothetical protein
VGFFKDTPTEELAMREPSLLSLYARRRVLLDQASGALRGHVVALWRLAHGGLVVTEAVSRPQLARGAVDFDLSGLLQRWGRSATPESLWVGCQINVDRWHVAAVRCDPPEPPPTGIERRSPERLVVELAALSLGALERIWRAADQETVFLCAALEALDTCLGRIRGADGLSVVARAHLLADLAGVAEAIDGALRG